MFCAVKRAAVQVLDIFLLVFNWTVELAFFSMKFSLTLVTTYTASYD
jgi:hypothetical protein